MDHFSEQWGVPVYSMLMVGDSLEDVEVGNAAGSATCLIKGGGNERPGAAPTQPPPGAVPTFAVASLFELRDRILAGDVKPGLGRPGRGFPGGIPAPHPADLAGAPPPGVDFLVGTKRLPSEQRGWGGR